MPSLNDKGVNVCYAMHLKFHSKWLQRQSSVIKKTFGRLVNLLDLLGLFSIQKSYGIAIWKSKGFITDPFVYSQTVRFKKCNKLYRPWHMDFFDWGGRRYAVVQTNQCNSDIALAYSDDGVQFTFYKKPLITNATIGKIGIYKPCAGVTRHGKFYLYYTAQEINDRKKNVLFLTTMQVEELFRAIDK